jgi:hypothetical protein
VTILASITLDRVVTARSTSLPISLSITTAQNNEIVIAVIHYNGYWPMEIGMPTITASLDGVPMTLIDENEYSYSSTGESIYGIGVAVFWGLASAAGSHTVQANISPFTPYGVILGALAFQGVNTSNPVDVHSTKGGSGTTASTSLTTNYANEVVIGCTSAQQKVTFTPASGFTEDYDLQAGTGAPSNYVSGETEHKPVASAGSVTVSSTLSAAQIWVIVAFSLAPPPPYTLTLNVDKSSGYIGEVFTFTGTLTQNGTPIAGATVTLYKDDVAMTPSTTTDTYGNYAFQWTADTPGNHSFYSEAAW